jgi:signal transduction histidine kinase
MTGTVMKPEGPSNRVLSRIRLESALLDMRSEALIDLARLALASFTLLAIYLDPTQPARHATAAYGILTAYLAYAIVLVWTTQYRRADHVMQAAFHLIDIATFGILMHLTQGPTSPFFIFFTFAMLAATLRWHGRGAIATACILVTLLLVLSVADDGVLDSGADDDEINSVIRRGAYLFVTGVMLAYFGSFREWSRETLTRLAAWPPQATQISDFPPLNHVLAHAAGVLRARRMLLVAEDSEEPFTLVGFWADGVCDYQRLPPRAYGSLVAPQLEQAIFMIRDLETSVPIVEGGPAQFESPPLDPALVEDFAIRRVVTAPFEGTRFCGRVFILEPDRLSKDLLSLANIVAARVGIELENHGLTQELAAGAAASERVRLARDMHDGVLQMLSAASLKLRALADEQRGEQAARILEVRAILADQQRRVRAFVDEALLQRPTNPEDFVLKNEFGRRMADVGRDWGCETSVEVTPPGAAVTRALGVQVSSILMEAAANAARHGGAKRVTARLELTSATLQVQITNDGHPLSNLNGKFDESMLQAQGAGPRSIRARVAEAGGLFTLSSNENGVSFLIELPLT